MQAVILAAGLGSRLKKLTENNTKSMVEVNGISLMERMLRILDTKSLSNIVVVTGYKSEFFINYMKSLNINTKLTFINNEIYDKTNNIYSMFLAKNEMINEDSILLESDLIFDDEMITEILEDNRKNLALVAKYERWMDGTCLKINENEEILDFIPGKDFNFEDADNYFKTINIYKFSKEFSKNIYFPFLEAYMSANGKNDYYEAVLKTIIDLGKNYIYAKVISDDIKWYEIDDEQDLNIASSIFSNGDEKLEKYQIRYGGYWRYPKLLDFCYLVNPYFPPKKMIDELKYNFKVLLEQYPSGLDVNSSLVAKIFDIKKENIHVPRGEGDINESCQLYNQMLDQDVRDIQLLGLGSNGHIGFNEPGTDFNSVTHHVALKKSTIEDNAQLFFNGDIDAVPKSAITMGIKNVMDAKKILLIATGERKADAVKAMIEGEITTDLPASILQKHNDVTVIVDQGAASKLSV